MYIELHSRSAFSFLEGASVPEELIHVCAALGMPAMALLDRDGVYGSPRFHLAAKKAGLRAHIGAEITTQSAVATKISGVPHPSAALGGEWGSFRLPLLVESRTGYQNLCRLITRMKMRGPKNCDPSLIAAHPDDFSEFSNGLICLTGDENGPLAEALHRGGIAEARQAVSSLIEIFGSKNVYVELQRHFDRDEEARNQAAMRIAEDLHLPLVATNGVAYAARKERELLDLLTCVREHTTIDEAGRRLALNSERHLKSSAQMSALFADLPQAIQTTVELSSRLEFALDDLGYQFPKYPVPAGETMNSFLRTIARQGCEERYGRAPREMQARARRQIERELALIEKLDLAGYFLIVWDIVRFCREQKILAQGRGSAANSAVCYSLGITAVDPVKMDLLFERFLSEERGEWPDIDIDLPSGDQRERSIQYVYERYGKLGAAMTANVITYRGRLAAREIGKALAFDTETLDRLSAMVGTWEYRDPKETLEYRFDQSGFDLRHPRMAKFLDLCLAVQDLPRHLGQHSGGMVICQGQLDSVVPLEPATMPGRVVVQWDKEDCADMGIIKVDLLGLGMMAVLEESIQLIRDHYKEGVDLGQLPPDDPIVYEALQKADTVGLFQVESRAQMSCLPRLRPTKFYDIVVQVALIRPGPIVGEMVNPFIKRRQGREPVTYPHPSLEPILERTLGVPLFQEQLLRMAMVAAGFTGGEAEELRRAMGFKRSEARMREIETKLRRGMERNGIPQQAQELIIQSIVSFALYGFPESHAASFALIAYASAYLKYHYLPAFLAAILNNQPMGFYHPATLVKDAQRHGLKVRPIDVLKSDWSCTLEPLGDTASASSRMARAPSTAGRVETKTSGATSDRFAVRLGLRYIRGLREEAGQAIVRERNRRRFMSIDDLALRVPELRKNELVMLASIGALNSVASCVGTGVHDEERVGTGVPARSGRGKASTAFHRRDALWQVERAARPCGPLLEGIQEFDGPSPLACMTHEERLVADFRGTGLTVGPHPMAFRREEMSRRGITPAAELLKLPNGKFVRTAGCVITRQRPGTAHGFVFLSLEDETGISNAIVTPDLFDKYRLILMTEKFLLVEGKLQNLDNVISVKAERLKPLNFNHIQTSSHDFH
ncbi:MAG TPA: error-prone DNA polymerase [Terriglobales bacterium]|nr:error-prone DNA polymerase [Terriglobales bacterium]